MRQQDFESCEAGSKPAPPSNGVSEISTKGWFTMLGLGLPWDCSPLNSSRKEHMDPFKSDDTPILWATHCRQCEKGTLGWFLTP